MSRRIVKKKSISVSVDLQVNVDESSTNENRRPFRKRRQVVKKQYYCSDSYNSEDDLEEKSRASGKRKHVHSRGKMMTNLEEHYCKRQDRQLMRPWLVDQVNYGDIPGLVWLDEEQTLIKIPWTHASRHGWDQNRDPDLFRRWAQHTGKFSTDDKTDDCSPKKWKANFRCAMNSLPDVKEEKSRSQKKGTDAFKVYRLLEEKARGQSRKKSRNSSESSDSDQHYKKYVTKADRLERHKTVTDRVRQKIQNKQIKMKMGSSNNNHIFNSNTIFHGPQRNLNQPSPQIPVPVSRSYEQQTSTTRYHHHQQSYSTCSESDDNSPVKRPNHLQLHTENVPLKRPCYTMTQSVESEVEVSTSMIEATVYSRKQGHPHYGQKHEHSYAAPLDNTIPSLVQDFETEPDSDYGSTSPTSSQGTSGENQEEQIAQCISDMESDYLATGLNSSQNSHTMFSPQTPSMNDEPMFCYTPQMHHMDTHNGIYKRSESREFYSVPGTTFDQSFPLTNLAAATPMQIENETSIDRNLQFTEF